MRLRHPDVAGAALMALAGAATVQQGLTTPDPGFGVVRPAVIPATLGVGMLLSAVWLLRDALASKSPPDLADVDVAPLALTALALLGYFLAFVPLGFILSSVAFLVAEARILGSRALVRDVIASVALVLALYVLFVYFLTVRLPQGPLAF